MARSSIIAVVTFCSVASAAIISIIWFSTTSGVSRLEPAVQIFGLLGGLTGVLAERRASARERRHLALVTLIDELQRDACILADSQYAPSKETPRPRVYPRLPVSATDAALTLGALAARSDAELLRRLHNWRDRVNGFNRRLELTEFISFTSGNPAEVADFERALHRSDGYLSHIRHDLSELQGYLTENYQIALEHYEELGGSGGPSSWRLFRRLRRLASSMPGIKAVRSAWWRGARQSSH
jgi:hypothetical protein